MKATTATPGEGPHLPINILCVRTKSRNQHWVHWWALTTIQTEWRKSSRWNAEEKWHNRYSTCGVRSRQRQWMMDAARCRYGRWREEKKGECLITYTHLQWKEDKWLPFTAGAGLPLEWLPCGSVAISSVLPWSLSFPPSFSVLCFFSNKLKEHISGFI